MKRLTLLLLLLALPGVAHATVAFDVYSTSGTEADPNWTHTPVGTPRAVIVWVFTSAAGAPSSVTYGGTSMTAGLSVAKATGEAMWVYQFFLGSSIPTGAQTVAVNIGGIDGSGSAITLTAAADTEVVDSDNSINSDSVANPSATLSLAGRLSFAAIGLRSGQGAVDGITALTGWTSREETDVGISVRAVYTFDTIGTTDVTAGWTQTADDAVAVAVAVAEVAAPGACSQSIALLGVGCR